MKNNVTTRRFNPLTGDWVLLSSGRNNRPWTGQIEGQNALTDRIRYDDNCALCPGNQRATGSANPQFSGVYVFDNDFPALSRVDTVEESTETIDSDSRLFKSQREIGHCRVVCFSEDHSITLARMPADEIVSVLNCFAEQTDELLSMPGINHVQIFENRGETMGCSNPHPHGQIWAQGHSPTMPEREAREMQSYHSSHSTTLLADYIHHEMETAERVVCSNDAFAVVVPYWAAWPFETLVVPFRPVSLLSELTDDEIEAYADIIRRLCVRYDNLFQTSFPYSSGIHQRAADAEHPDSFHLHMHFYPPLLRSTSVRKFMVGYEMLAEAQRDLSPEEAAAHLRDQSEVHFLGDIDKPNSDLTDSEATRQIKEESTRS